MTEPEHVPRVSCGMTCPHDMPTWQWQLPWASTYRAGRSVALYDRLSIYTRSTNILGTLFIKRRWDQRYPRPHLLVTGVLRVMWYTSISVCSATSPTHIQATVDLSWRTVPWPGDQCLRGLGARPRRTRGDATRAATQPMVLLHLHTVPVYGWKKL